MMQSLFAAMPRPGELQCVFWVTDRLPIINSWMGMLPALLPSAEILDL
jgi:hypothetical protein